MKKKTVGSVILFATAIVWGFSYIAQVLGAKSAEPFLFNACRFLLGGAVLLPVILLFERDHPDRKKKRLTLLSALLAGFLLLFATLFQQLGAQITENPGKSGFITSLYTVLTPILYFAIFRRKTGLRTWIGAALAVVGLCLLCYDGENFFSVGLGEVYLFAGAIFWALQIIVIEYFVDRVSMLKFASFQFLACGFASLILALILGQFSFGAIQGASLAILYCGLISVGAGYTGQIVGQKLCEEPTRSAIFLSLEGLFSALCGALWNLLPLGEDMKVSNTFTGLGILGGVLLFVAIVIVQVDFSELIRNRGRGKKQKETAETDVVLENQTHEMAKKD